MFSNIGGKIKLLAQVICWIGIIGSIIAAISMFVSAANTWRGGETYVVMGIVTLIVGCIGSWISCFVLYGFGELIETCVSILYKLNSKPSEPPFPTYSSASSPKSGYAPTGSIEMPENHWPD